SRTMWNDLWPYRKTADVPIRHITNGVHTSSFLAPQMRLLYDRHLGADWMTHMDKPEAWAGMANVNPGELWEIHQILKSRLFDFIRERVSLQTTSNNSRSQLVPGYGLEPDILTIGFARRFATYKRADLLMTDMERFEALINDSQRPIQIIYA